MTLTLIDRVRHAHHSALPARLAAKAFALAVEICRYRSTSKELARLSQKDLRDIGLAPELGLDVQIGRGIVCKRSRADVARCEADIPQVFL